MIRRQNDLYMSDYYVNTQPSRNSNRPSENGFDYPSNFNPGSRRNSYKKRMAPTPPPIPGVMRNDASWSNRTSNRDNISRNEFRPTNPVHELEMLGKKASMDVSLKLYYKDFQK